MTHTFAENYDVIVIGAGHAGVEADWQPVGWAVRPCLRPLTWIWWPLCLVIPPLVALPRGLW